MQTERLLVIGVYACACLRVFACVCCIYKCDESSNLTTDWEGNPPLMDAFQPLPFIWKWSSSPRREGGVVNNSGVPGSRSYDEFLSGERPWLQLEEACGASMQEGGQGRGRAGGKGIATRGLVCDVTGIVVGGTGTPAQEHQARGDGQYPSYCNCSKAQWHADTASSTLRLLTPMPLFGIWGQELLKGGAHDPASLFPIMAERSREMQQPGGPTTVWWGPPPPPPPPPPPRSRPPHRHLPLLRPYNVHLRRFGLFWESRYARLSFKAQGVGCGV
jgi:hypothetical protein